MTTFLFLFKWVISETLINEGARELYVFVVLIVFIILELIRNVFRNQVISSTLTILKLLGGYFLGDVLHAGSLVLFLEKYYYGCAILPPSSGMD